MLPLVDETRNYDEVGLDHFREHEIAQTLSSISKNQKVTIKAAVSVNKLKYGKVPKRKSSLSLSLSLFSLSISVPSLYLSLCLCLLRKLSFCLSLSPFLPSPFSFPSPSLRAVASFPLRIPYLYLSDLFLPWFIVVNALHLIELLIVRSTSDHWVLGSKPGVFKF